MPNHYAITNEQAKVLASMLDQKYVSQLGDRYFDVHGCKEGQVITIRVTLRDAKGTFVYPVEARMATEDQDLTVMEARDLLLDYIDAYFDEYLNGEGDTYLTIDWSTYECDGFELQMRGQILNSHLEQLADDLIAGKRIDLERLSGRILN